jgi:glutaminyl-peptide cyclotransferase
MLVRILALFLGIPSPVQGSDTFRRSSLRMDDLESGRVLHRYEVPTQYFAEGLTNWGSNLIQLTWQANTAFVYDRFSFRLLRTFHYEGEGWGLTQDGRHLILSDKSPCCAF